ncbi:lipoprotein [Streptomyces sp. NRRL F-5727]|uniref:lipoprotein n=1 Tax=Streptomyces sp. NRRL F-5727 TaxID=1463871 RepID=UPI0004C7CF5A|nr:lipoprotein [Streptomyces sp. NRRL F-5727]
MPARAPLLRTALLAAALLTACGTTPEPAAPAAAPTAASPAPKAPKTLGGPGTACVLPVSFSLAEDWRPDAIDDPEDPEFAALTRQGPAIVRCEVDAKRAGNIGFIRVWTAKGPARPALEGFVRAAKKTSDVVYRDTRAGGLPAVEVTYTFHNEVLGESKEERAFAVATPQGAVILHLGGLDTEEHRAMLPAYELAKSSLRLS